MNRNKILLGFILLALCLSSCGLFKKKNKCVSCPTWDQIETGAEIDIEAEIETEK